MINCFVLLTSCAVSLIIKLHHPEYLFFFIYLLLYGYIFHLAIS